MADNKENKVAKEIVTEETINRETNNNKPEDKIPFFNEKKWIMAYWFKRSRKAQFTMKYLREQWSKWWTRDSDSISNEMFQEILIWIKETVHPMTKDEVKKKRREVADCQPMPEHIKKLAHKKGYYVKKCSTRNHPLKVSGYAIFKNKTDKKPVYGKKFDLTAHQVKQILEAKEDKQNDFKTGTN